MSMRSRIGMVLPDGVPSSEFRPMLASPADLDALTFPVYGSPKLDGIRAAVVGGRLLSRTLKEIPNRHIFHMFNGPEFEGLDGELIVGEPTSPTCYRDTVSGVMAFDKTPGFTYWVFDKWDHPGAFYARRIALEKHILASMHMHVRFVNHLFIGNREQLDAYEAEQVGLGHEGIMLAAPEGKYKFGRATTRGGELLKVKRFVDAEAEVIGVEEEMFNGNVAQTNELGRTKRSTAKDGLIGKGTMGALVVRDLATKVEFNIGTGFTAADRAREWPTGLVVKYKSFPVGVKDKPRHPVFLGVRPAGA